MKVQDRFDGSSVSVGRFGVSGVEVYAVGEYGDGHSRAVIVELAAADALKLGKALRKLAKEIAA